ncbi:MAG: protein kinase [Blautia sp.]|nr:protein kinase [Blautia sp.]
MSTLEDIYEICGEIGSGGGGVVYLAFHKRLRKQVVLKADKRPVTTKEYALRREVDILKTLSNPYIPQVYDYFVENGTVFTVMEYIEGESLHQLLKQGRQYDQKTILTWMLQLLSALDYLHSPIHGNPPQGFVHCDIKPSNLILRPDGRICLIDFNISRALGDSNAFGYTAGYSSPEHYGIDYSSDSVISSDKSEAKEPVSEYHTGSQSSSGNAFVFTGSSYMTGRRKVKPDVRSDVYSAGATMYRLFSGKRPASDAREVVPLTGKECPENIAAVISKAMRPNPDERYQTAVEMKNAILDLKRCDRRIRSLHKKAKASLIALCVLLGMGILSGYTGLRRMKTREEWLKTAEYAQRAYDEGKRTEAMTLLNKAAKKSRSLFTPLYPARLQEVYTTVSGVYDLSASFKPYDVAALPSDPLSLELSPDGTYAFALCGTEGVVLDTKTMEKVYTFEAADSARAGLCFAGNAMMVYAGNEKLTAYDLAKKEIVWTGMDVIEIAASADKNLIAALSRDGHFCYVYDTGSGEMIHELSVQDPLKSRVKDSFVNTRDSLFCIDDEGTLLALSTADGVIRVYDLNTGKPIATLGQKDAGYNWFSGGFFEKYLAFSAEGTDGCDFAIVDMDAGTQTGGFHSDTRVRVKTDTSGIYVSQDNYLVRMEPDTGDQQGLVTTRHNVKDYAHSGEYSVIADKDTVLFFEGHAKEIAAYKAAASENLLCLGQDTAIFGSYDQPGLHILRLDTHEDGKLFSYDPEYFHLETRISADEKKLMLFSLKDFRIIDTNGKVVNETSFPDPDQIYDRQYKREDGVSYLEVSYYDGTVLCYDAGDGHLLSEEKGEPYTGNLDEVYNTASWYIESPAYENGRLYEQESGRFVRELREDGNLAYATEMNGHLILQFINEDTGRWIGLILNDKGEEIARVHDLCDVMNGKLIFDDPSGIVKGSPLYEDIFRLNMISG